MARYVVAPLGTIAFWLMVAAVLRPEIGWDFMRTWAFALTSLCIVTIIIATAGYTLRDTQPIPARCVWGMGLSFSASLVALASYSAARWGESPNWVGLFGYVAATTVAWVAWILPITIRQVRMAHDKR